MIRGAGTKHCHKAAIHKRMAALFSPSPLINCFGIIMIESRNIF